MLVFNWHRETHLRQQILIDIVQYIYVQNAMG